MKSGTIKSAQRDAAGRVTQLPLEGTIREFGVTSSAPSHANARSDSHTRNTTTALDRDDAPSARGGGSASGATSRGAAVLCNIAEQSWILHRTHGTFVVAGRAVSSLPTGCELSSLPPGSGLLEPRGDLKTSQPRGASNEPGESYALTVIGARTGAIDLGDKRTLEFPITAREIANDLAREINSDGGEGSYFGVFVCAGDEPTDAELLDAREQLAAFYRNLVAVADREWERTQNVAFISDLQRRAARELKLEKEWSYEPQQRMDCPACGEKLKPGVAVCRVCGAVLDRAKAAQFGLVAQTATPTTSNANASAV